jgi:hypothetical protein
MDCHHISRIGTVAPEPEGMAQFMQGRGLEYRTPQLRRDKHGDLRLKAPAIQPLHLHHLEQTAAIAGPPPRRKLTQGRPAALEPHMGSIGIIHTDNGHDFPPGGQSRTNCLKPPRLPAIGRDASGWLQPDTPAGQDGRPLHRAGQGVAVAGSTSTLRWLNGQRETSQLLGRRAWIGNHAAGNPTPRAISVARRGTKANPTSSTLMIQPKRVARASLTFGNSPLRKGMAQRM